MTSILKSVLLATIIVNLSSVKALADVTSQQVWDGLRTAMTASGFRISSSETRNGNRLTIGDLQMSRRVQDPGSDAPFCGDAETMRSETRTSKLTTTSEITLPFIPNPD